MPTRMPLSPLPDLPPSRSVPDAPAQRTYLRGSLADNGATPLGMLPTPIPDEIAGFARLYERKYGATLESDQAQRLLSGLMRFLYLTRTASPNLTATASPDIASPEAGGPIASSAERAKGSSASH